MSNLPDSDFVGDGLCTVSDVSPSNCETKITITERQLQLRALRAKSDAAIAAGMPTLTVDEINAEVSELRGNELRKT